MNIRIIVFAILIFFITATQAQTINKMVYDTTLKREVLTDYCDRSGLQTGEFGEYYMLEYEDYIPNDSLVKLISNHINKFDVTIVFGSWCSDSEEQVPRFYKVLDKAGYDDAKLTIIAVNRTKHTQEVPIDKLQIERIPTFIVFHNGKEAGRIVETPVDSPEKDLWEIIQ